MAPLVEGNATLRHLNLNSNQHLTDAALEPLIDGVAQLAGFVLASLVDCRGLSAEGVAAARERRPELFAGATGKLQLDRVAASTAADAAPATPMDAFVENMRQRAAATASS